MIYTDAENKRWWDGLSKQEQSEVLETIRSKATTPGVLEWAELLVHIHGNNGILSAKNLASIRKWSK